MKIKRLVIDNWYSTSFSQLGFGFLEAGSVRYKKASSILIKIFLGLYLTILIYWLYGFSYGDDFGTYFIVGTKFGAYNQSGIEAQKDYSNFGNQFQQYSKQHQLVQEYQFYLMRQRKQLSQPWVLQLCLFRIGKITNGGQQSYNIKIQQQQNLFYIQLRLLYQQLQFYRQQILNLSVSKQRKYRFDSNTNLNFQALSSINVASSAVILCTLFSSYDINGNYLYPASRDVKSWDLLNRQIASKILITKLQALINKQ